MILGPVKLSRSLLAEFQGVLRLLALFQAA